MTPEHEAVHKAWTASGVFHTCPLCPGKPDVSEEKK
jgi:hypothetical protein